MAANSHSYSTMERKDAEAAEVEVVEVLPPSMETIDALTEEDLDGFDDEEEVSVRVGISAPRDGLPKSKTRYDHIRRESGETKTAMLAYDELLQKERERSSSETSLMRDITSAKRLTRSLSKHMSCEPNVRIDLDEATNQLQIVASKQIGVGCPISFDLEQVDEFELKNTHRPIRGRNIDMIRARHGDALQLSDMINTVRTISEPVVVARRNTSTTSLKSQQHKKINAYHRQQTVHERLGNSLHNIFQMDPTAKISIIAVLIGALAIFITLLAYDDVAHTAEDELHHTFIHSAALNAEGINSVQTNGEPFYLELTGAEDVKTEIVDSRLAFQQINEGEHIDIKYTIVERETAGHDLAFDEGWTMCFDKRTLELENDEEVETDHTFDIDDAPSGNNCTFSSSREHAMMLEAVGANVTHSFAIGFVGEAVVLKYPELARNRVLVAAILMVVVYAAIVSEIVHRTLVALVGSFVGLLLLTVLGEPPDLAMVIAWMDGGTLALLFGMMILVHELSLTGLFQWCAVRALAFSHGRMRRLLVCLCAVTAVLSAFLDNVTTMLLLAPVTIELCRVLQVDCVPFLICEALFSNIGGAATMIGDPPNIIIGNMLSGEPGITFEGFIVNVAPATILASPPTMVLLLYYFRDEVKGQRNMDIERLKKQYPIKNPLLLTKVGIIIGTVILLFFLHPVHHVETSWIALIGAVGVLIACSPHDLHDSLAHVEWDTLIFFAALFVLIEAVNALGLIEFIGSVVTAIIASAQDGARLSVAITAILWISALTSGVLDNIPFTATMVPVIQILADDEELDLPLGPLVWALSLGACLGGNGTLVGASANLVTAGIAEHEGHVISFTKFSKIGMLTVFTTCVIANLWLLSLFVWT